jgi:hypothetical protein
MTNKKGRLLLGGLKTAGARRKLCLAARPPGSPPRAVHGSARKGTHHSSRLGAKKNEYGGDLDLKTIDCTQKLSERRRAIVEASEGSSRTQRSSRTHR